MQSLIALFVQLSGKAWTVIAVTVLCGGAATAFYFSQAHAGSNSTAGNPTVAVQAGQVGKLGGGAAGGQPGSVPVVPEANAGLALIPVVAAVLLVSSRRFWPARRALAADSQNAQGASDPQQDA